MHATKLNKVGNSTGLILPRDVLAAADLQRVDEVRIEVRSGRIEITKTVETCNSTMDIGQRFAAHYRRTMAILSK